MGKRPLGPARILVELTLIPSHPVNLYPAWRVRQANSTDNVPVANFHAPSKTVFHENGTVDVESAADGAGTSGSGSTEGIVDGSAAKIDSLGSVRSGTGTGLDN